MLFVRSADRTSPYTFIIILFFTLCQDKLKVFTPFFNIFTLFCIIILYKAYYFYTFLEKTKEFFVPLGFFIYFCNASALTKCPFSISTIGAGMR